MELRNKLAAPLPQGKSAVMVGSSPQEETRQSRTRKHDQAGLVGFVNIGNSCYMNSTLQALSNCPPFCQYFVEQSPITPDNCTSTQSAAAQLSALLKKVWASERHPGHLSPRGVGSAMKNRTFKGSQQQDAQEFLRCLLMQIHDETGVQVPPSQEEGGVHRSCDHHPRDSMVSCDSDTSAESHSSLSRLVGHASHPSPSSSTPRGSPLSKKRSGSSSSLARMKLNSAHSSPAIHHSKPKYSKILSSSAKSSVESIPTHLGSKVSLEDRVGGARIEWAEEDVFLVDVLDGKVTVHKRSNPPQVKTVPTSENESRDQESPNRITNIDDSLESATPPEPCEPCTAPDESPEHTCNNQEQGGADHAPENKNSPSKTTTPSSVPGGAPRAATATPPAPPCTSSIVSEVFEGILESKVKCLSCKKVSETREPFQDLSLPIPGRKEIAKFNSSKLEGSGGGGGEEEEEGGGALSRGFCTVWNYVTTFTRDLLVGPPTDLDNCLSAFFDASELKGDNRYYCSHCKSFQNSVKEMSIVMLPEVLCIHLKRFRFDAYISTKISRNIRFPLTGLSMESFLKQKGQGDGSTYDLSAVITHYGGAGGGHYVAFAKNPLRNSWYEFNDTHVHPVGSDTVLNTEGYVLFYRRVPPKDSQVLSHLDTNSLLPRPGTTLPSPDVCYISRHWLHLVRHHTHPGPVFQYDYACSHGAVLPMLSVEQARSRALCIRRDVWEEFQRKYGGGPLVPRLEICRDCKELLSQLTERRKVEKDEVHKLTTSLPVQKVQQRVQKRSSAAEERKQERYLIYLPWVQSWQRFIHCSTLACQPPVAIDNTPLFHYTAGVDGGKGALVLNEGAPYRRVTQEVWQYFYKTYGGGPVVVTSLEPNSDST